MAKKPKPVAFVNAEGYTETLNPEPMREPTKQEIAATKAAAKIAAKAEKALGVATAKAVRADVTAMAKGAKAEARAEVAAAARAVRAAAKDARAARLSDLDADGERKYTGTMLALADRVREGVYVKGVTGQLRSDDELAQLLDGVPPNGVVQMAKAVLELEQNPYAHLNMGQQSMNLRNKLRGAVRKGVTTIGTIRDYIAANDLDCSESIVAKAAAKAARVALAHAGRAAKTETATA